MSQRIYSMLGESHRVTSDLQEILFFKAEVAVRATRKALAQVLSHQTPVLFSIIIDKLRTGNH